MIVRPTRIVQSPRDFTHSLFFLSPKAPKLLRPVIKLKLPAVDIKVSATLRQNL